MSNTNVIYISGTERTNNVMRLLETLAFERYGERLEVRLQETPKEDFLKGPYVIWIGLKLLTETLLADLGISYEEFKAKIEPNP